MYFDLLTLGTYDGVIPRRECLFELVLRDVGRQVRHPDGKLSDRVFGPALFGAGMVQLESDGLKSKERQMFIDYAGNTLLSWSHWLAVWDDFAVEFVHGHEGRGVRVELEEPVGGQLSSVLVPDQLDLVERVVFPHQAQGVPDEVLSVV